MASDEDYMSFLDKANRDLDEANAAAAQSTAPATFKALDAGVEVPKSIKDVCQEAIYVSDADEPFEEVSLKWTGEGGLPSEGMCCLYGSASYSVKSQGLIALLLPRTLSLMILKPFLPCYFKPIPVLWLT